MTGEIIQIVNRTKQPLSVTYDGRQYVLAPGINAVPRELVPHAKNQLRVMGTEDPGNPLDFDALVGCPALGDDVTPIEQSKKAEALDRKLILDPVRRKASVVQTGRGLSRALAATDAVPVDALAFQADRP